jgi:hypothetical protein
LGDIDKYSVRSKFNNKRTVIEGKSFHSKGEAARYLVLRDRFAAGVISDLRLQVSYRLTVNDDLICRYIADFVYIRDGLEIVEDYKGAITDVFRLKRKLMRACHGITIYEVTKADAP